MKLLLSGVRLMGSKEIFVDPFIIDKIKSGNINSKYIDLGSQKELCELLNKRAEKRKKLLTEIYKTADSILSPSQFEVFISVFRYGYKIPVLARIHGVKRSTYYTHYYRALEKLRKALVDKKIVKKKNMNKTRIAEIKSRNWKPF